MKTPLFLALLLSFVTLARAETWVLTFEIFEHRTLDAPDGNGAPREERSQFTQRVVLGADFVTVDGDGRRAIYDFTRRRIINVDLAANTYTNISLYALPAFFEHELFNRNMLGTVMRESGVGDGKLAMSRFDNETALRVISPTKASKEPPPVITAMTRDGVIEFRHAETIFARCAPSDTPIPTVWRHRFTNYLAYFCAIHPQVRQAIVESGCVPRELTFTGRTTGRVTATTVKLVAVVEGDDPICMLPTGARLAPNRDSELDSVLATVEAAARDPRRPSRADTVRFANAAVADRRPLDALLALLEFGLQSGEQLSAEIARHKSTFNSDPGCQTYLAVFDRSAKAGLEDTLAANQALSRTGLKKAHMLDLQRAYLFERLGRGKEAIEDYLAVLRANPYHAGALHDLGMLHARGYEEPTAWRCWDAARQLYPDHPMMRDVAELERRLQKDLPDFF